MRLALLLYMGMTLSLIRALVRAHTYDLRRNPLLRLGLAWGSSMGLLSVGLAVGLAVAATRIGGGREAAGQPNALLTALFLAPPLLFGLLSGALGTVWNDWTSRGGTSTGVAGLIESGTGLYSPEYMMDQLRHALSRVARSRKTVTILILECQELGDDVSLRLLADTVQPLVRVGDTLGRVGWGRLLLLVQGELPCEACLIGRMAQVLREKTHLWLRAGVARWPEDGLLPTDLLTAADLVLKASWKAIHAPGCSSGASVPLTSPQASR
jgi:GGDEF domain-containing protein